MAAVGYSHYRVSRLASSCPKDHNFQFYMTSMEAKYSKSWNHIRLIKWFKGIPDDTQWNCLLCVAVLAGLVKEFFDYSQHYVTKIADICYNIFYAVHMVAMFHENWTLGEIKSFCCIFGFVLDVLTYGHYLAPLVPPKYYVITKLACYFLRLHRPFRYLWALNEKNLKGSILGIALKYIYTFLVIRIACAIVWIYLDMFIFGKMTKTSADVARLSYEIHIFFNTMCSALKPIGDFERMRVLIVMLLGCLVANMAAASLSLVVGLYMRREEAFRSRFRLIMEDMKDTHVPSALRHKVETFYKMYWHKQKGVSVTQLLPTFPPTLPSSISTDIYFEAQQRSQGLVRDSPYTYSYRTTTQSQVLTLQLDSWEYLLQHFPVSRYAIYKHIPGHPYNKNPQEAQTPKKGDFFNAPKTIDDDDDDDEKRQQEIAITRKARRSTIYGSFLPYAKPTDEEILKEDKDDKAEEVSLGSDVSLSLDNLQTGPSLQQFGEFLQVGQKKEEVPETEESEEEEEEVTYKVQRRETIFQRLANKITGKTDTEKEDNARKDTLLIEEEMAATNELLSTLKAGGEVGIRNTIIMEDESKSTKAALKFIPGFVKDEKEIEARKDAEEDEEVFTSKRKERLSFLPGLVQSQSTPEKIPMSKGPRRSILPGLAEKKSKEEGEEARKLPRLSFLPGLIQTDDKGNIIDIKPYKVSPKATTSKGKSTEPSPGESAKSYEFEKLPEISLKIHDVEEEPKIKEDIEMKNIGSLEPKQTTVDEKRKDIELQEIRIDVPEPAKVPYKEDKGHLQEIRIDAPETGEPKQGQSSSKSMLSFKLIDDDDDEKDIDTDLAPDSPFPIMRPLHSRKSRAVAKDEEEGPRRTSSGESTPEKKRTEESPKDK